jgi:aminoglycoside phosphotransferase
METPSSDEANLPNASLAAEAAAMALGSQAVRVRRFTNGLAHFVFEVTCVDQRIVVVRIADKRNGDAMARAARLSRLLRPLGVPLPRIMAEDLAHQFPYLVLERLPGTDLGDVIGRLPDTALAAIAARVAEAQAITSRTRSAGRYGYAVEPEAAPYKAWSEVIDTHLARSRGRIVDAGLFELRSIEKMTGLIAAMRARLDAFPAIPFLHDTTSKNVIVEADGAFSGIVDVDDLCFGDPRYVVALTWASTAAHGGSFHYVRSWMRIANFEDDPVFRLYVALFILDFMSEHGQTFNGNQAPSSRQIRDELLRIFEDSIGRIETGGGQV